MKTSSFTLFLIALLSIYLPLNAQSIEKTLIKSFNLGSADFVEIDLDGQVEVRDWNNSLMRVHIRIGLETGSEAMLKSLVTAGRYNLEATETSEGLAISAPGMGRTITVRGTALKESVSYVVFKPEQASVRLKNEASSQADLSDLGNM